MRSFLVRCCLHSGLLAFLLLPLGAQAGADRQYLDSLLVTLDPTPGIVSPPPAVSCRLDAGSITRLCEGMRAWRSGAQTGSESDLARARTLLERVAEEEPKWSVAWYTLGAMRVDAFRLGVPSKEGILQPLGSSYAVGGARALERAVTLDSSLTRGWELLALTPIAWQDKKGQRKRVADLRHGRPWLSGRALVGAAMFELDAGSPDSAVALLRAALAGDGPRGRAQITLARALFRLDRPVEGRQALLDGAAETDSVGLADYAGQLAWVADSAEMRTWAALTPAARPAWLAAFWARRDVAEGRTDGERLIEHYRRVNYAYANYRMVLPASGQQKFFTSLSEASYQRWLSAGPGGRNPGEQQMIREYGLARVVVGAQKPQRAFDSHQSILDDRGVMYIRHGAPTEMAETSVRKIVMTTFPEVTYEQIPSYSVAVWRYDRPAPETPLTLSFISAPFQGSIEATVLVPTLLAEGTEARSDLCHVSLDLCPASNDLRDEIITGRLSISAIASARAEGLEAIRTAATTDRFARAFAREMHPSIQYEMLELARGGAPRLVTAFAIPGEELTPGPVERDGSTTYRVRIQLMASRTVDGRRVDLDTTRTYAMPHVLTRGEYLAGLVELPLPDGRWSASLTLSQEHGAGALARLPAVVSPSWQSRLTMGNLVLGRDGTGLKWHSGPGGMPVAMNPLNAYPAGSSAKVYTQIAALTPGSPYQATFEFFEGGKAEGDPALKLSFSETPTASRVEMSRTIVLSNLKPGRYLVRLTITSGRESATTTAGLTIEK